MTVEDLVTLRKDQLRAFFLAWFGRSWRRHVARRLGRRHPPRWLAVAPASSRPTLPRLAEVERLAVSMGFRPEATPPPPAKSVRTHAEVPIARDIA